MQVIATFTLDCASLKLRHYLCIGWGFPLVIVTMWASLIYATADKAAGGATVVESIGDVAVQVANGTANNAVRRGKGMDRSVGLANSDYTSHNASLRVLILMNLSCVLRDWQCTGIGLSVGPRLRELASRSQKESGGRIHATKGPPYSRSL